MPKPPMTMTEFYSEDRRRRSAEIAFGLEWTSDSDPYVIYGVHWVADTKEIYVLRGPQVPVAPVAPSDASGGVYIAKDAYEVIVLGSAEDRDILDRALDGWEERMSQPNSLQWVRDRLFEAAGRTVTR